MIKIVVFGIGQYYRKRAFEIAGIDEVEVCAFIDNNSDLNGKRIDGIPVFSPDALPKIDYDYIVLMSIYADDMKRQLLALEIDESKIVFWNQFRARFYHGIIKIIPEKSVISIQSKGVLIVTMDLNYDGGSLAAVYAAKALKKIGCNVVIAVPGGNDAFIEEYIRDGIIFAVCPALPYLYKEEIEWIKKFDIVIVNVLPMIRCACEISKIRPVLWWIHEVSEAYEWIAVEFGEYISREAISRINILAVSRIAKDNFNKAFPNGISGVMPFGIPDEHVGQAGRDTRSKRVFAIIGAISPRKAQMEFVKAISMFSKKEMTHTEFWIIGRIMKKDYYENIKILAGNIPQIKILGEKTREELHEIFHEIDVVVCASLEETMSITIVEGMMHKKICITTDTTGIAEYIQDGKNGYICRAGDSKNLYEVMKRVNDEYGQLGSIKDEARKTYEKYFTLERLAERLEQEIAWTEKENLAKL